MNKKNWLFQPAFYVLIIFYIVLGYSTLGFGNKWATLLFREDKYFENVGALSLFIAAISMFYVFIRASKTRNVTGIHWIKLLAYLGIALLFFFGAGEEISWGQRIFNIKTPTELAEYNLQDELNIHNLAAIDESKFFNADDLFTLFWMIFAALIPTLAFVWTWFKDFAGKFIPIVHWAIGLLFIFNYIGAKLAKLIYSSVYSYPDVPFIQAIQEIKESNYEFLLIFFSFFVFWELDQLIAKRTIS